MQFNSFIAVILGCSVSAAFAEPFPANAADQAIRQQQEQIIREQQRQQYFQQKMQPPVDVRLDGATGQPVQSTLPHDEVPCFPIQEITLIGDSSEQFQFTLQKALAQSGFSPGVCLGALGINQIMTQAQNTAIERGYTLTRILAAPQDLKDGRLALTVMPGRIHKIRYIQENNGSIPAEHAVFANEMPVSEGHIFNLHDLEQGLENLKRIPSIETDIQIMPAEMPNGSDIFIHRTKRRIPFRFSVNADDSGSRSTGKYQGGLTLSIDNPLGLSDLFYLSGNRDVATQNRLTDSEGLKTDSGTRSHALHYSVPFGNWLFAANYHYNRYHQAVAGLYENYDYNGDSRTFDVGTTRLLYRDASRKTSLTAKFWQRESHNYINDAEIEVQRRRTAGWALSLDHKEYIARATLTLSLGYRRGTGIGNSLRAPEETFNEGSSRMQLITGNAGLYWPFSIGEQTFSYDGGLVAQWNQTPLTPQDRFSIGSRYTVRGFDGETTLSAERGGYWRNDLAWHYAPGQQIYMGLDIGHVAGFSAQNLLGKTLAGSVIGMKGQLQIGGELYYDFFIGKPMHKPQYFQTAKTTAGFNLIYSF